VNFFERRKNDKIVKINLVFMLKVETVRKSEILDFFLEEDFRGKLARSCIIHFKFSYNRASPTVERQLLAELFFWNPLLLAERPSPLLSPPNRHGPRCNSSCGGLLAVPRASPDTPHFPRLCPDKVFGLLSADENKDPARPLW